MILVKMVLLTKLAPDQGIKGIHDNLVASPLRTPPVCKIPSFQESVQLNAVSCLVVNSDPDGFVEPHERIRTHSHSSYYEVLSERISRLSK